MIMKFFILIVAISAFFAASSDSTSTISELSTKIKNGDEKRMCDDLREGQSCDRDDCDQCGYCWDLHSFYYICQRTVPTDPKLNVTGVIVHKACDSNLWWNPDIKPSGVDVGGTCDLWQDLSKEVQDKYLNDPNCVTPVKFCEYGQDDGDHCSANYFFFDPTTMTDRENLACSSGLLWDPSTETCRACKNVVNLDKSKCICP